MFKIDINNVYHIFFVKKKRMIFYIPGGYN